MAKKTKAQLEKELAHSEKQHKYWEDHHAGLAVAFEKQKEQYAELEEKYNAFIANHRNICEAHATQITDAEIQLGHAMEEIKQLKEHNTQLSVQVMTFESAMQAMAIHIRMLIEQRKKGKDNA